MNDSDQEEENNAPYIRRQSFDIRRETGQRGAKPESNQIREKEISLIGSKKDKLYEIFKGSSDIH